MKEVITVSLSQSAGHLQCHFNNQQESYLDYHTGKHDLVDSSIFLNPTIDRLNNTVSYNPRTLLIDCHNGYGSLGKYEYVESTKTRMQKEEEEEEAMTIVGEVERIQLGEPVPKSEYQVQLDGSGGGGEMPVVKLTPGTTKYWTDYTRLIYDSKSFGEVANWEYRDGKTVLKQDPQRVMRDFDIGVREYKELSQEFLDERFRVFLEECDNLSGLNVVTEIDSSWGGVSSELLVEIRDEFLPKTVTTTWGLYEDNRGSLDRFALFQRIKTTLANASHTSLFVPLNGEPNHGGLDAWHTSAVLTPVFETVNLLYAQRKNQISMTHFIEGVTMGNTHMNFVTDVKLKFGGETTMDLTSKMLPPFANDHTFSKSVISRYTLSDSEFNGFENLISHGTEQRGLVEYEMAIPFQTPDSFPKIFDSDQCKVSVGTTTRLRPVFKEMKTFVSKNIKGDDRELYIDEIDNYLGEYEYGWSDDEDYDDF